MFFKKKLRSPLLFKYIFSYLFIFFIPFILMSYSIYINSVGALQKEIEHSSYQKLQVAETTISKLMSELQNMTAHIANNSRLHPYQIKEELGRIEAIQELKHYKMNNIFSDEIALYYYDEDFLLTSSGLYSHPNVFLQYRLKHWEDHYLFHQLQKNYPSIEKAQLEENHENILMVFHPIKPNNPFPYANVFYFIKESMIVDLIKDTTGTYLGNTYIIDDEQKIIASHESDTSITVENIPFINLSSQGINQLKINGKNFYVATITSQSNHWTYIMLMDTKQFNQSILGTKTIVFVILISLFLLGIGLAVIFGKHQYKPIQSLLRLTKSDEHSGQNEIESIQMKISDVIDSHEKLSHQMNVQKVYAQKQILLKLIEGNIGTENIDVLLSNVGLKLSGDFYYVAIVKIPSLDDTVDNIDELIQQISSQNARMLHVDLLKNESIALIISGEMKDEATHRDQTIRKIYTHIQNQLRIEPLIGVGKIYEDIKLINHSYIEALSIIQFISYSNEGIVYFDQQEIKKKNSFAYPLEEIEKLVQSLKLGDQKVASEVVETTLKSISQANLSLSEWKCIQFEMINTIIKTAIELNVPEEFYPTDQLVNYETFDELKENLYIVIGEICNFIKTEQIDEQTQMKRNIEEYIEKNYMKYEFSLTELATYLNLTVPYLSRFFRANFGMTFTEYVFDLRLNKVKRELIETDKLIKEIIIDVGYRDVSNFIRQFKKVEDYTPGQYREMKREK